jgi:DNA replication factor GINS
MNLGELQSVQSKERQSSSLQHLRASFYQEAGNFVQELRDKRDRIAAEADDPFGSDEVKQLTDDMETAQRTVESLYERRVGKVVKMASIAAADMPYDDDGLTDEEAQLFEILVTQIKQNRTTVLSVLDGGVAGLTCSRTEGESTEDMPGTSRPADLNRQAEDTSSPSVDTASDSNGVDVEATNGGMKAQKGEPTPSTRLDIGGAMGSEKPPTKNAAGESDTEQNQTVPPSSTDTSESEVTKQSKETSAPVDRQVVRITGDVGDIFGVDGRTYDLSADDVVDLPEENASILVGQDNAESLE